MKLVKVLAATILAVGLVACEEREGTLTVTNALQIKDSKNKTQTIQPGSYTAEVGASSETKAKIKLKMGNKDVKAYFIVPKGTLNQSQFTVPAGASGQNYDLIGDRTVSSADSAPVQTVESCTWYSTEYQCWQVSEPQECTTTETCDANGTCRTRETCTGGGSHQECGDVSVSHSGSQDVEYVHRTTTDRFSVGLAQPGRQTKDAEFVSSEVKSGKHYLYEGSCN